MDKNELIIRKTEFNMRVILRLIEMLETFSVCLAVVLSIKFFAGKETGVNINLGLQIGVQLVSTGGIWLYMKKYYSDKIKYLEIDKARLVEEINALKTKIDKNKKSSGLKENGATNDMDK